MAVRLPPIGFWSYARQDDEFSNGKLSSLRSLLRSELQQQYGREPISLFQDVAAIPPGAEWDEEIHNALTKATFFIPIITPNFVESEWCFQEVEIFLERERDIVRQHPDMKGRRRIFPINYIDTEHADPYSAALMKELLRLQWFDLRPLRFKDQRDESVQLALSRLAATISKLLRTQVGVQEPGAGEAEPAPDALRRTPAAVAEPVVPVPAAPTPEPEVEAPGLGLPETAAVAAIGGDGWLSRHRGKLLAGALALAVVALVAVLARPAHRQAIAASAPPDPVAPSAQAFAGRWTPVGDANACTTGEAAIDIVILAGASKGPEIRLNGGAAEPMGAADADNWLHVEQGLWRVQNGTLQIVADGGDQTKPAEYQRCG